MRRLVLPKKWVFGGGGVGAERGGGEETSVH